MAFGDERVSVRHLVCCATLFRGLFTLLTLFRVAVSHGSTFVFSTTFGDDRGAKAAAEAGSKTVGIMTAREGSSVCTWTSMMSVIRITQWKGGGGKEVNYNGDIRPHKSTPNTLCCTGRWEVMFCVWVSATSRLELYRDRGDGAISVRRGQRCLMDKEAQVDDETRDGLAGDRMECGRTREK